MIHEVVQSVSWVQRFPLAAHLQDLDKQGAPDFWYKVPDQIDSPRDLAYTEQWRQRAFPEANVQGGTSVDVFLPAFGEPANRACSKTAGLPYLRRGEWPHTKTGQPMAFLGQLCIADSRDVLPVGTEALPGDVLLIFQQDPDDCIWSESSGSPVHFIWQTLGIPESELLTEDEAWTPEWWFEPLHFHRYRTAEYRDVELQPSYRDKKVWLTGQYAATKLGGFPVWWQDEHEADGLGTYFACLHSINPSGMEYPLINVPESPWGEYSNGRKFFMLGDVGTLYLFAKGDGKIGWLMQCG